MPLRIAAWLLYRWKGRCYKSYSRNGFNSKVHREARELPVYFLTVAKSSPKLKEVKKGSCTPVDFNHLPAGPLPQNACGPERGRLVGSVSAIGAHELPLSYLIAAQLSNYVDRTIVDKTELTGLFDYHLEFVADNVQADTTGPSIFTALQEQLGLKLVPAKAPVDVLVIDHVERPSEN